MGLCRKYPHSSCPKEHSSALPDKLMGRASKQMIYEVYGNCVEGLEDTGERIAYMGRPLATV